MQLHADLEGEELSSRTATVGDGRLQEVLAENVFHASLRLQSPKASCSANLIAGLMSQEHVLVRLKATLPVEFLDGDLMPFLGKLSK